MATDPMGVPAYENPANVLNSSQFFSGKACVEKGCQNPAGTAWSPLWCWQHNAERLRRISKSLAEIQASFDAETGTRHGN